MDIAGPLGKFAEVDLSRRSWEAEFRARIDEYRTARARNSFSAALTIETAHILAMVNDFGFERCSQVIDVSKLLI